MRGGYSTDTSTREERGKPWQRGKEETGSLYPLWGKEHTEKMVVGVCMYTDIYKFVSMWALNKKTSGKVLEEWNKEPMS